MQHKKFLILVILIVGLAFFVRGFHLLSSPPSLYWEEAAIGYDAYSILKTGKDHHGHFLPLVAFESFGDWKPGLYFYFVVLSEYFVGLSPLAVRLPALISGTATVIGVMALSYLLFKSTVDKSTLRIIMLFALLIGAVSPWGIMFSRAGWESMLATCLLTWGSVLWLYGFGSSHKIIWVGLGSILLALSTYTYHAARLIAPLVLLLLVIWQIWPDPLTPHSFFNRIKSKFGFIVITGIIFVVILLPIVRLLTSDQVSNRFNTTSIFADGSIVRESNQLREAANYSFVSRIIYHRYVLSLYQVAENMVSHFNLTYLFISGDSNWRHSTQMFGQLYWLDAVFLPLGLLWLWKNNRKTLVFLTVYLLITLIPSSLSSGAPHAVRTLASLPAWWMVSALGLLSLWQRWSTYSQKWPTYLRSLVNVSLIMIYLGQFIWFYYSYQTVYPKLAAHEWQYGYFELYQSLRQYEASDTTRNIYITREQGRPAMYYFFFNQIDPSLVQSVNATAAKDQSEFLNFGKYYFIDDFNQVKPHSLIAASPVKMASIQDQVTILQSINSIDGSVVWLIASYE